MQHKRRAYRSPMLCWWAGKVVVVCHKNCSMPKKKDSAETIGEKINPHIVACLVELEKEARTRGNDKLRLTYKKALRSAQRYPLPLRSGEEARTLEGVGPVLAKKIDDYLNKRGLLQNDTNNDENASSKESSDEEEEKTVKKKKKYVPKFKSAAWAIIITLYRYAKNNSKPKMSKSELISASSSLTDTPMIATGGKFQYCGWSCVSSLTDKYNLVICGGRPKKFELTHDGRRLARKLHLGAIEMLNEDSDEVLFDVTDDEEEEEIEPPKKKKTTKKSEKHKIQEIEEQDSTDQQDPDEFVVDLLDIDSDNESHTSEVSQQEKPSASSAPKV
jgi:hypothetical protein